MPGRFGATEPPRRRWRGESSFNAFWADSEVGWDSAKRGLAAADINRMTYPDDTHSSIWLRLEGGGAVQSPAVALFRSWAARFTADYGYLHYAPEQETAPRPSRGVRWNVDEPNLYVPGYVLEQWQPELYWATVFGPPYVALLGADRLRSTPAAVVEEYAADHFYLQLTPRLSDVAGDRPAFLAARAAAKEHLGVDAFWRDLAGSYRAPRFVRPLGRRPSHPRDA
jgi:hypothetical protein